MRQACGRRAAVRFYLSCWLVWVCVIKLSHLGKNNGNPYLMCENKSILHMYCCGTRKSHPRTRIIRQKRGSAEIPPEDQNNSSETRLCRVSDEIILVRGWDFLVPQQYIMMDTFSRPVCDCLRFYMNSVSSAFFFLEFLRLFQSKK